MTKEYSRNLTADETVALRSVRKSGSVHAGVALGLTLAGMTVGLYQQSAHAEEETGSKDSKAEGSESTGFFGKAKNGLKSAGSAVYDTLAHNRVSESIGNTVSAGWHKVEPAVKETGKQVHTFYVEQRDRTPGTSRDSDAGVYNLGPTEKVESFNDLSWKDRMKEDGQSAVRNYSNIVKHIVGGANIKGDYSATKTSVLEDGSGNNLRDQSIVASFVEFGHDIYDISQSQVTPGEVAKKKESDVTKADKFKTKVSGDLEAIVQNGKGVFEAITLGHDDADDSKDTPGIVGGLKTFGGHLVDAVKLKTDGGQTWSTSTSWRAKLGYIGDKASAPVAHTLSGAVGLVSDTVVASFDVAHDTVAVGVNVVSPVFRTTTLASDKAGNVGDSIVKFAHDTNDVVTSPKTYVQTVDLALDVTESSALIVEDAVAGTIELAHVPVEAALGWNKYTKHVSNVAKTGLDVSKAVASTALDFQAHRAVVTPDFEMLSDGDVHGLPVINYWKNSGVRDETGLVRDSEFVSSSTKSVEDSLELSRSARSYRASLTNTRKGIEVLSGFWAWDWVLDALFKSSHGSVAGRGPNMIVGSQTGGNQVK